MHEMIGEKMYFCLFFLQREKVTKVCTTYFPIRLIKGKKVSQREKSSYFFLTRKIRQKNFDDGTKVYPT